MQKWNQKEFTSDVECKCKSLEMLETLNHSIIILN